MSPQISDPNSIYNLITGAASPSSQTPPARGEKKSVEKKPKKQKENNRPINKPRFSWWAKSLIGLTTLAVSACLVIYLLVFTPGGESVIMKAVEYVALMIDPTLPRDKDLIDKVRGLKQKTIVKVVDADGELMGVLGDEKRIMLTYEQIPEALKKMLPDQENSTYWTDHGIYLPSIMVSAIRNMRAGRNARGASTLTQQLVKRILLTPEKNIVRKIKEAVLSWWLSKLMSKEELFTLYVNIVPFDGTIGFAAASEQYFDKDLNNLPLDEMAVLVQMLRGPNKFSPVKHPAAATKGRDIVLSRMVKMSHLSASEAEALKEKPLKFEKSNKLATVSGDAPECLYELKEELMAKYGEAWAYVGGTVKSTCRLAVVRAMRSSMSKYLEQVNKDNGELPTPNAAAIVIDSVTGELIGKVVVGYTIGGLDLTKTPRPFGSIAKPFYYAQAFDEGFTPATLMWDSQLPLPPAKKGAKWWSPNSHSPTQQPMRLRTGLADSKNTLASRLVYNLSDDDNLLLGTKKVIELMKAAGIDLEQMNTKKDKKGKVEKKFEPEYSLVLGAFKADLTSLVRAYAAFDNGGQLIKIHSLLEINDKKVDQDPSTPAIDPALAYQVRNVLESTIEEGTGRFAKGKGITWGKTGTTNSNTDALFIGGFSHGLKDQKNSRLMFGVWMGYREGSKPMGSKYEGSQTLRMAVNFLPDEVRSAQSIETTIPQGVVVKLIDPTTGLCVEDGTAGAISEVFLERFLSIQCGGVFEPRLERLPRKIGEGDQVEGGGEIHTTPEKPAGFAEAIPPTPTAPEQDGGELREIIEGPVNGQPSPPLETTPTGEAQPEESGN